MSNSMVPLILPSTFADNSSQHQENTFAFLKPLNSSACQAFHDAVNFLIENPTNYVHTHQFFQIDSIQSITPTSQFTDDGKNADSFQQKPQWKGAFQFSLNTRPRVSGEGWSLGTGIGLSPGQEVDVMLGSPTERWSKTIARKHARLCFHRDSGRITVEARHTVQLSGMDGATAITSSEIRVIEDGQFIGIGDCLYAFEYTSIMDTEPFFDELAEFMKTHIGAGWKLHKMFSSATAKGRTKIGSYTFTTGAFAKGSSGQVTAGWAQDGSTVAIKRFISPAQDKFEEHQIMMDYLGEHENIITLVESFGNFGPSLQSAYCVYKPLAMGSLSEVMSYYTADVAAQVTLLHDYLKALSYLHDEKRVMHRDVNPNNLAVLSSDPPRGILLDFDSATRKIESFNHGHGTPEYMAPEICELRRQDRESNRPIYDFSAMIRVVPYNNSIDMWALGLSAFAVYSGRDQFRWTPYGASDKTVDKNAYEIFRRDLERRIMVASLAAKPLLWLVDRMTQWEPRNRIQATPALDFIQGIIGNQKPGVVRMKKGFKRNADGSMAIA